MTEDLYNHSIFWIEVDKIKPNPYQPRQEFNDDKIRDLAESIRQYGVLQPLVVTRREVERDDGGLYTEYELIAGERRLRASKVAGVFQVPAIIRTGEQSDKMKLELAIIENLQREDLNPIDRAEAFMRLVKEFNLKHVEVAKKVGRSREYVSNTMRILALPQEFLDAVVAGKITEGHTRPLLMLGDRPAEQMTLFRDIQLRHLTVRESERIARSIAVDKARRPDFVSDPEVMEMEERLSRRFGARVKVEKKQNGGRLTISFFSSEDLKNVLVLLEKNEVDPNILQAVQAGVELGLQAEKVKEMETNSDDQNQTTDNEINVIEEIIETVAEAKSESEELPLEIEPTNLAEPIETNEPEELTESEEEESDEDLYSIKNFSL